MPQKPQNKMIQTLLKYYNQFIIIRTEALIWIKIATDIGNKLNV